MEDFIDLGIDAVNPVQVSANDRDSEALERQFGDRIVFRGEIDT
jgi:uroporphyrinogen decarboxylase